MPDIVLGFKGAFRPGIGDVGEVDTMSRRRSVVACGCLVLLAACTFTRKGTLTKLPTGPEIAVTVAVTETSATVKGTDAETGEEFEGVLHAEEAKPDRGMAAPAPPLGGSPVTPGVAPPPMTGARETIQMSGRLEGSQGTSLKCVVQVERTLTLKGSGTCRIADTDDLNPAYRLRF
jgi:hypothetical protein